METLRHLVNGVDWDWFSTNPANVAGLILAMGGLLLNFKTDGKGTKLLGMAMLIAAVIILAGKLLYENGIVPIK